MSIPRRLCADTIRDFARYVADGNARHPALEAAECYIRGEGLPEARQAQPRTRERCTATETQTDEDMNAGIR